VMNVIIRHIAVGRGMITGSRRSIENYNERSKGTRAWTL